MAEHVRDSLASAGRSLAGVADRITTRGVPPAEVPVLLSMVRELERAIAGITIAVAEIAHGLADAGAGGPAEAVLARTGEIPRSQAKIEATRATLLSSFPHLRAGVMSGRVRTFNLDALARVTSQMTRAEIEALAQADESLAEAAARLGVESFARRVRRLRDKIRGDHGVNAAERARRAQSATVSVNRDGDGYRVFAELDPIHGAAMLDAFTKVRRALQRSLGDNHDMSDGELAAEALVETFVRGAATEPTFDNSRVNVVVNVLTDIDTLAAGPHEGSIAETFDGQALSPPEVGRLCCDATLRRIRTLPDGNVNVSVASRTATAAQRAALRTWYRGCAISGAPWSQVEIHHVIFHEHGGRTELANLIPLSRRWHHLVHDKAWTLRLDSDRTLWVYRPDGSLYGTYPCPAPILQARAA